MQVGNTKFNYALQQLPDLTYQWTTPTDVNFTNGTNAGYYNPGTVYLLNATNTSVRLEPSSHLLVHTAHHEYHQLLQLNQSSHRSSDR